MADSALPRKPFTITEKITSVRRDLRETREPVTPSSSPVLARTARRRQPARGAERAVGRRDRERGDSSGAVTERAARRRAMP